MLQLYFRMAMRLFQKNFLYTAINILGLSISLGAVIIIALYVQHELRADSMHTGSERIYRIGFHQHKPNELRAAVSSIPMGPTLQRDYPEILDYSRLLSPPQFYGDMTVRYEDDVFYEKGIFFADTNFFDFFNYEFLFGNAENALSQPHFIVISETAWHKFFGNTNPLGKIMEIEGQHKMQVSAVVKEHSLPSHLRFHYLIPFSGMNNYLENLLGSLNDYRSSAAYTYLKVQEGFCPESFSKHSSTNYYHTYLFPNFPPEDIVHEISFEFVALGEIYFDHNVYMANDTPDHVAVLGNKTYLLIFSGLALFLIIIAAINYTNMAITQSVGRSKEVGLQKVMGAAKEQIAWQYFIEATIFIGVCIVFALIFMELLLPVFNHLMHRNISFWSLFEFRHLLYLLLLAVSTAFIASVYPAMYLSGIQATQALKNQIRINTSTFNIKDILFTFQFVVSVFLVIVTLFVYGQFSFMLNKDLGLQTKDRVTFTLPSSEQITESWMRSFKHDMQQITGVKSICSSESNPLPGNTIPTWGIRVETQSGSEVTFFRMAWADPDLLDVFGINIVEGRNFSYASDLEQGKVVINQAAARRIGWDDAIGARLRGSLSAFEVVGICNDFNYFTLDQGIDPMIIVPSHTGRQITFSMEEIPGQNIIGQVESVFKQHFPQHPFNYQYIQMQIEQTLAEEKSRASLMGIFSAFSILISLAGLFNMVAFSAQKESRTLALRKVLGANLVQIGWSISRKFFWQILLATIIASPLAWWYVDNWLKNYAYTIPINLQPFLWGILTIMIVAILAVSYHALRSYTTNAANILKSP
jgi:putative ABC transport system permease protein